MSRIVTKDMQALLDELVHLKQKCSEIDNKVQAELIPPCIEFLEKGEFEPVTQLINELPPIVARMKLAGLKAKYEEIYAD